MLLVLVAQGLLFLPALEVSLQESLLVLVHLFAVVEDQLLHYLVLSVQDVLMGLRVGRRGGVHWG